MRMNGIRMYPFNTTLMGVVKGVLDYYGKAVTDAEAFGSTGLAFFINIHEQLCPSAPYVWNWRAALERLGGMGVEARDLGFFSTSSDRAERSEVEELLRSSLDGGVPCSLCSMEHQLITGYDEEGFDTAAPWPRCADYPPRRMTRGTWRELGDEIHVGFTSWRMCEPAASGVVPAGVLTGIEMHRHPEAWSKAPYASGPGAWDLWLSAVRSGHGSSQGNRWCGLVWSECRQKASSWMYELACSAGPQAAGVATGLSSAFGRVARNLLEVAGSEVDDSMRIELLEEAKAVDGCAMEGLADLAEAMKAVETKS